jgi:hypothetical protein
MKWYKGIKDSLMILAPPPPLKRKELASNKNVQKLMSKSDLVKWINRLKFLELAYQVLVSSYVLKTH